MPFHADLHVHSKHSRATSRDLDLEHLAWWAARKGIGVVGTGDCVHPQWLAEIKDKLVPTGGGLFRLRPEIESGLWKTLPPACRRPVRFMEVFATLYHNIGLNPNQVRVFDPNGRPQYLVDQDVNPIGELI